MSGKRASLWALVALGAALIGCGGSTSGSDGGTVAGQACTQDSDCGTNGGFLCHPLAKVCVQTCASGSTCPTTANTCAAYTNPVDGGTTASICQCTSDTECGGGMGSTAICGLEDKICETKCGSDANCASGRNCDTDAGSPTQGQCFTTSPGTTCNPASMTLGAGGGPDTCAYGEFCDATTSLCSSMLPSGTCTESGGAPAWNQAAKMAPVIISATATLLSTTNTTSQCTSGGPAGSVTLGFYAPNNFTSNTAFSHWYTQVQFSVNGTSWNPASFDVNMPMANTQFGTMSFGIACDHGTGTTAAIYIQDESGNVSNTVCVSW